MLLFDTAERGHTELYRRRFLEALSKHAEAEMVIRPDGNLRAAAAEVNADLVLHLFADAELRRLLLGRQPVPVGVLLFRPRFHYPSLYSIPLTARERAKALAYEALVAAWRRRRDALAVLTFDEGAALRWARRPGAPAYWLPEPPVGKLEAPPRERVGLVLYGAISARKRLDLVADAVVVGGDGLELTLAGVVEAAYRPELDREAERMRAAGATVHVLDRRLGDDESLRVLAGTRCVLLPYVGHYGMSGVLVQAAAAGTPVVTHDRGLLGHLVERYGLGRAVDCTDPKALRAAMAEVSADPDRYRDELRAFARLFSGERFERTLVTALRLT